MKFLLCLNIPLMEDLSIENSIEFIKLVRNGLFFMDKIVLKKTERLKLETYTAFYL